MFIHGVIHNFKPDVHEGMCPTVSVLIGVQAGVALTTVTMYNSPKDCRLLLYFVHHYPCKCENLLSISKLLR